jgi:molybdopterin synthase catalytic subunit
MDYLKTQAPFWKKEVTPTGERWVEARGSDDDAAAKWIAGENLAPNASGKAAK